MSRTFLKSLLFVLLLAVGPFAADASANAGFERFVTIEAELRAATNEGMRQRLALLGSADYSAEADERLDEQTRARVAAVYAAYGTSAAAHASFGTRHADEIEEWIARHPEWRSRQQALQSEFESLSSQFSAAR